MSKICTGKGMGKERSTELTATSVRVLYGQRIILVRQNEDCAVPTPIPRRILTRLEQTNFKWLVSSVPV